MKAPAVEHERRSYASGARILSIGIAATGVLTFAYFSVASHVLNRFEAKRIDVLWTVMFVIISVIYRPVEQLLSRTIADRRARGQREHPLRGASRVQVAFALAFLITALVLRGQLVRHVFDHYGALYDVLVIGTVAYAASYFARGWLAGHEYFALYGGLVLMEATSRLCFALAGPGAEGVQEAVAARELSTGRAWDFALVVSGIMLAEQTLLNAAVLTVDATALRVALAGVVFNVLLIARAPLQLFQAIQTSLLPHLTGLEATEGHAAFSRAIRITVLAIAGFALAVALALLAFGPFVMGHLFGQPYTYNRFGLAVIGLGMGFHLTAGALNQAALARGHARAASACWLAAAVVFVAWMFTHVVHDQVLRTELGYAGATALLALALALLYRRGSAARIGAP